MRQEFNYGIPIVVLLALIFAIASDYCYSPPLPKKIVTIEIPQPFNPLCYVASFEPEAPEIQTTTTTNRSNLSTVTYSGTVNSGVTTSTTTTL